MELACRNVTEEPSEANLVKLLDLWSADWKQPGRTRAVGPGAYERYATLGLFGHGGVVGISNATGLREACAAVNRFMRTRFPDGTWTSIAAFQSPHGPAPRHPEHDKRGGRELRGQWLDMHDKPVSFDARRYHKDCTLFEFRLRTDFGQRFACCDFDAIQDWITGWKDSRRSFAML
ncbi:hypothetical protein AK812_SmicGene34414 [Symbiodinium microadriaticum]|uniref:Uncharacterized protein n=1 Tax=Symbiodinium microadriaticum TaxID=2951 RepID=A0A1Q9CP13_SYMMI|nr:hypothetical protein AK812_SmicGene34414 [Symbiodinium microadriaticum]